MAIRKIDVILADDHPLLVTGIRHEISKFSTIHVAETAQNSTELVDALDRCQPHILVTDYAMPGGEYGDGMQLISFLRRRYPDLKIIVFTSLTNPAIATEMLKGGVKSVLSKVDDAGLLVSAILAVYAGATYVSPSYELNAKITERKTGEASAGSALELLSKREFEVVRLYLSGLTIDEIAAHLHRTKQTVSAQKRAAMRKLGIERDPQLFQWAFELGLGGAEPQG